MRGKKRSAVNTVIRAIVMVAEELKGFDGSNGTVNGVVPSRELLVDAER